jgi:hypothetical protein
MEGFFCFFIFVVLVMYEWDAVRSEVEGAIRGGCTCGEHPFSEKRNSESRVYLHFC